MAAMTIKADLFAVLFYVDESRETDDLMIDSLSALIVNID
jgi:hypothetical protein